MVVGTTGVSVTFTGAAPGDSVAFTQGTTCTGAHAKSFSITAVNTIIIPPNFYPYAQNSYYLCYSTSAAQTDADYVYTGQALVILPYFQIHPLAAFAQTVSTFTVSALYNSDMVAFVTGANCTGAYQLLLIVTEKTLLI